VLRSASIGIAYTYSEPTIWFETIMDLGTLVRERGLKNVMVTNGYIETAPLADLLRVVDAMNIDIKSMDPQFYRRLCKGSLPEVLRTCEQAKKAGCHIEITNLLIPGENDSPDETRRLVNYIASSLGKDTPLHFSRYFPRYRMHHTPTPSSLLADAWNMARERLDYVYIGNSPADGRENTMCPRCGELLVSRSGYVTSITPALSIKIDKSEYPPRCLKCGTPIAMVL
jgi:pyruvate formate lyase activating enzyme